MKKLFILIISFMFIQITASPQSCLSEGGEFYSQADIDNFQANYPGCTEIEGFTIISGDDITNLNGLSVLTSIGGYLKIEYNTALVNLSGLEGLTSIGGYLGVFFNDAMTGLTGLENVTSIGGMLSIRDNPDLISLTGLDNIDFGSISSIMITYNHSLSNCAVQSICEYLISPTGTIEIHNNAEGCNSTSEVGAECEALSVKNMSLSNLYAFYPNPISTSALIEYQINKTVWVKLSIYNHLGQHIETLVNNQQPKDKHQVLWNAEGLPPGIYYSRLQAGEQSAIGKMVLLR